MDSEKRREKREEKEIWSLGAALLDGAKSIEELKEYYNLLGRRFGIYFEFEAMDFHHKRKDLDSYLSEKLDYMIENEWLVLKENKKYKLTDTGKEESEKMLKELERGGYFLKNITKPENVSKVTLIIHFILAALKLPAALFSGSVGLLNDALDTLMDGISSIFVYWGVRKNKERLASAILVVFMLITGGFSLFEAVSRLFSGMVPNPDFLTFTTVIFSAVICLFLWLYQKFSGVRHQSLPIITQSVDSKNHVLVGISVTIALIASIFRIPFLDPVVGIIIGILILKGAGELFLELLKSSEDDELDLSKYGFTSFNRFRVNQMKRWLLYRINKGNISNISELESEAYQSMNYNKIAMFKALDISETGFSEEICRKGLKALTDEKLIKTEDSELSLTNEGIKELNRAHIGSFSKKGILLYVGKAIRIVWHAALFAGCFVLFRWLFSLLPEYLNKSILLNRNIYNIFGYQFTIFEIILFITGFLIFYAGTEISNISRRSIRHNRHETRKQHGKNIKHEILFIPEIVSGPFKIVRQPVYSGMIISSAGIGIAQFSLWGFIYGIAVCLLFLIISLITENLLFKYKEDRMKAYCEKTKRMVMHPAGIIAGTVIYSVYFIFLFM